MYASARKCMSILRAPSPEHFSHLPPLMLNENLPALYPRWRDSGSLAKSARMWSRAPVYVAGLERGDLPSGDWSTTMTRSMCSMPSMDLCAPGMALAR